MNCTESDYKKELANENICNICNVEMKLVRDLKRKHKYSKKRKLYECNICGNQHRERTQNEILRDLGARE